MLNRQPSNLHLIHAHARYRQHGTREGDIIGYGFSAKCFHLPLSLLPRSSRSNVDAFLQRKLATTDLRPSSLLVTIKTSAVTQLKDQLSTLSAAPMALLFRFGRFRTILNRQMKDTHHNTSWYIPRRKGWNGPFRATIAKDYSREDEVLAEY